jgi:hypothetical protein
MKPQSNLRSLVGVCFVLAEFASSTFGHDTPVHEKVSEAAALSSAGLNEFLQDQFGAANSPFLEEPSITEIISDDNLGGYFQSPIGWIKSGSRTEDNFPRYKNHFYDPTKTPAIGLTDRVDAFGIPSATWASVRGGGALPYPFPNNDSFQNARDYEFTALTKAERISRGYDLAHMLYTLGRVLHLNQDLSQPDHTRNDNHAFKKYIEPYGLTNYSRHPEWFQLDPAKHIQGWTAWRQAGFTKLEAFWDRNKYAGTDEQMRAALDNDASGTAGEKLGLAELSNGNFLGEDAVYREYFKGSEKHAFPFPKLRNTKDFDEWESNLPALTVVSFLKNGQSVNRISINKDKDGIPVNPHSVLLYLGTKPIRNSTYSIANVTTTINDPKVLDKYHAILLPKAVEYSAGILDYFFRGKLSVAVTPNTSCGYDISIKNESGQDLYGGEFRLYWDNQADTRTQIEYPGSTTAGSFNVVWSGQVAVGGTVVANFRPPTGVAVKKYTLIYRGTIGSSGGQPVDPVESDSSGQRLSIAVKTFEPITLECTGGAGDAPDYYQQPIPVQPEWIFFKELPAVEALLAGTSCDTADPELPCLIGIPLWDVSGQFPNAVEYGTWNGFMDCNIGGKYARVFAEMYYADPFDVWQTWNPTWKFIISCQQGGNWVHVLLGSKSTGDDVVGSFVDFSSAPWGAPTLYHGPMTLCKEAPQQP